MKKITISVTLRAVVVSVLGLSFLIYLPLRISSAGAAHAARGVKTEAQWRSEAARYEGAIRAISAITTMKLDTGEDLKKAIAILDRERPNLKLGLSRLVVIGLSDSTYTNALKRKLADKQAAEAFAKALQADHKAILTLAGATSVVSRMQSSTQSDAAVLRRAGERLKEAAERIKKAGQRSAAPGFGVTGELTVIRVSFSTDREAESSENSSTPPPQRDFVENSPYIRRAVQEGIFTFILYHAGELLEIFLNNLITEEGRDKVAACHEEADARYNSCRAAASELPSGFPFFQQEAAIVLCAAQQLLDHAVCPFLP